MSGRETLIVLFGMFGGLSVNITRLPLASLAPKKHRITFDLAYWLQFIGLTLSGGIVALARDLSLPANPLTPIDSLYIGLSLPVLFKPAAEQLMDFAKEKNPGDDGK
jgi:hypothetical protein